MLLYVMRSIFRFLTVVLVLLLPTSALAGEEPWVDAYPSVDEVFAVIGGSDQMETLARQSAAFYILNDMLRQHIPINLELPPRTRAKWNEYRATYFDLMSKAQAAYSGEAWTEYFNMRSGLQYDKKFQKRVVNALVPSEAASLETKWASMGLVDVAEYFAAREAKLQGRPVDRLRGTKNTLHLSIASVFLGFIISGFGGRLLYRFREYEFENRLQGGAVGFASYEDSLKHERGMHFAEVIWKFGGLLVVLGGLVGFFAFQMIYF